MKNVKTKNLSLDMKVLNIERLHFVYLNSKKKKLDYYSIKNIGSVAEAENRGRK
jgi:hypothetical protein